MSDESLSEWLSRPFRVGWTLWAGVFWPLAGRIAPLAVVLGLVGWIVTVGLNPETDDVAPEERPFVLLFSVVLLGMAFGVALVGVLLSGCHTDLVRGSPYRWALRRFVPWIGTWALMIAITTIGLWFFLVPGIYLALRLFWADEFALIDGRNPIASLKASWELTRSGVGAMLVFQLLVGLVACVVATAVFGIQGSILAVMGFLGWVDVMPFVGGFVFVFFGLLGYGAVHAVEIAMFYGRFGEEGPGLQEPGQGPASNWLSSGSAEPVSSQWLAPLDQDRFRIFFNSPALARSNDLSKPMPPTRMDFLSGLWKRVRLEDEDCWEAGQKAAAGSSSRGGRAMR